jgi:hypothetical protein
MIHGQVNQNCEAIIPLVVGTDSQKQFISANSNDRGW